MSNKKSSVQWIVGKLGDLESMFNLGIIDNIQYYEEKTKLLDQAKAMHKEEIEEAELRGKEIIIIKHTEHGGGNNEQQ